MCAAPRRCTFSGRHRRSALPTAFLQVLVDGRDQAIELDLVLIEQVQIIQIPATQVLESAAQSGNRCGIRGGFPPPGPVL